jgi:molybdopterin-guanine dinucleotide biosynthesis protein A
MKDTTGAVLAGGLSRRFVTEAEIRAMDPQGRSFLDLDTRAEYERAKEESAC